MLCHIFGVVSLGVLGLLPPVLPVLDSLPGWRRADCAVPGATLFLMVDVVEDEDEGPRRESGRVEVEPVVLVLHLRSLCSEAADEMRRRSSMSGVGVVLREEEREWEPSRPRRVLGRRLRGSKGLNVNE